MNFVRNTVYSLAFVFCIFLVTAGQRYIGGWGLGAMLTGLAGLLMLLAIYNRKYR